MQKSLKTETGIRTKFNGADSRVLRDGGWKVHLTIGPSSYTKRSFSIKRWLRRVVGPEKVNWKYLSGGEKHEKDFTVYLGSWVTMVAFVEALEKSRVSQHLDPCNAGPQDRMIGATGKCAARFDARGRIAGRDWLKGWKGVPFKERDVVKTLGGANREVIAEARQSELRELFGEYFLPNGIE